MDFLRAFPTPRRLIGIGAAVARRPPDASAFVGGTSGAYLSGVEGCTEAFPPVLQKRFGYIPNIFRAQFASPL
jgi:hypothetical protein